MDSQKAVQFRKWATDIIEEYTVKGFAMNDERLKHVGSILTQHYFDEFIDCPIVIAMAKPEAI